jgi:hypothetical protein
VTGEQRKLNNDELNDLYSLPNIVWVSKSRKMRWAGHVARMGDRRSYTEFWWGKTEGKKLLGRHRRKWEGNIKMDQEARFEGIDYIYLAYDRDM